MSGFKVIIMDFSVTARGISKNFGGRTALYNINLCVPHGATLALLGPNGAGKSTLLNILCTALPFDSGDASVLGLSVRSDAREIRRRIGAVFQGGMLDGELTVYENLSLRGALYSLRGKQLQERISFVTASTGIEPLCGRRYSRLSGGQKRRCDIARALIHSPDVLFLDEPSAGLDPESRADIWRLIADIKKRTGVTTVFTSHYIDEASEADSVAVIRGGNIVFKGSPAALAGQFSKSTLILHSGRPDALCSYLERNGVRSTSRRGSACVPLESSERSLNVLKLCRGMYSSFEVLGGSVESAYFALVGRKGDA